MKNRWLPENDYFFPREGGRQLARMEWWGKPTISGDEYVQSVKWDDDHELVVFNGPAYRRVYSSGQFCSVSMWISTRLCSVLSLSVRVGAQASTPSVSIPVISTP